MPPRLFTCCSKRRCGPVPDSHDCLSSPTPGLQNCAYFLRALDTYTIPRTHWLPVLILRTRPAACFQSGERTVILVTGASGTVGKAVLKEVARSSAKHKAMHRSADEAAKAPSGTSPVIADFAKKDTLAAALRDVESGYLGCAPVPDLGELESNMIEASVSAAAIHPGV